MPALLERPPLTKTMYQALKRHIMRERERKKQEQEQDAILERQRKEKEMRKKKEEEDNLTLEQTKEQIGQLEKRLESLKQEKHELFSQLKKVLHQEDESRKRAQIKEQSELFQQAYQHQPIQPVSGHSVLLPPGSMSGRPTLYRPAQTILAPAVPNVPVKRPRSPSPPPATQYQYETKMIPVSKPQSGALYPHSHPAAQGEFKTAAFHSQGQPSQVTYVSQSGHSFQQASVAYSTSKSPSGKYNPANQSAFSSYPSHFAHQQQKQIPEPYPGFPIQRLPQPGFMSSPHASNIPLQQQLEQANQKAGFNDKLQQPTQIRAVAPLPAQQAGLISHQLQQPAPGKGSIMTGFSGRSQAPPGPQTSSYQPVSSQASYPGAQPGTQGRPGYNAQPPRGAYF